ncbi:hypothetical protein [Catenulispora pinistramenti]|nr:hypothetical protein [Catenulispora pinistramenti]
MSGLVLSELLGLVEGLPLTRVGDEEEAGLLLTSLPWPRAEPGPVSLGGQPTDALRLGAWPGTGFARRLILAADAGEAGAAPAMLPVVRGDVAVGDGSPPWAATEVFERSPEPGYVWERSLLRLGFGGRSVGLAMGLRTGGTVHWWEACRLVVVEQTEERLTVEMGGTIAHRHLTGADHREQPSYTNTFVHLHNWLNASIHVRLHRNGVCEVFARHVNARFVDDGLALEDVVPVLGIQTAEPADSPGLPERWDGSSRRLTVGAARFDFAEVARLATPTRPGDIRSEDGWVVLQPYAGVELFGGACPDEQTGDPFLFRSEDRAFPRGMARTLRFSLSLSDRSPTVVRYLAPDWWYGLCEELTTRSVLPVTTADDERSLGAARRWVREHMVRGGFEDATVPRNDFQRWDLPDGPRYEPGWEGELPYALLLDAWRTGDGYQDALRAAYAITDIAVDHAAKLMRMHGHPPNALSLPMSRMQGTIAAYLETGDPFLLRTAQTVVESAHATHLNSWPRLAVGRDACYLRAAILLYRYLGDEYFLRLADEGAQTVAASQRANGTFGDQGGGAGMHAWMGYITKPWMGLLALGGLLDRLELRPEGTSPDEAALGPLHDAVLRFGDWLLAERGAGGWSYQHDYDGRRTHEDLRTGKVYPLPTPPPYWHHDTLARLLAYCSVSTGDPAYLQAWRESHDLFWTPDAGTSAGAGASDPISASGVADHVVGAALQFVPALHDRLWAVRWPDGSAESAPAMAALAGPASGAATVSAPDGRRPLPPVR